MNNDAIYLIGALLFVAFTGSWHCAVMCGPIALGLSQRGNIIHYHIGRALSYITAGAVAGSVGRTLFRLESFPAKLAAAIFLSLFFILPAIPTNRMEKLGHLCFSKIARKRPGLFIFGVASVFLPCGWLWTFFAAAAASGSPWAGSLILAILWVSSLPALSVLPQYFKQSFKQLATAKVLLVQRILSAAGIYAVWSHFFL